MRRAGIRRAKNRVSKKASSILVAANVARLADSTSRYRFTEDSIFPSRSTIASVTDGAQEPARQFGNSIGLPPPDGFPGDQLSTNAQRNRPSSNEAECGPLVHAAGRNHRHLRKHRFKIPDVTVASDVPAGNNFDEIRTKLPCGDDPSGSEGSGNHDCILLHRELHSIR